jgi:Domain of unknown function (DUF1905)/Bacteriocin-protection, YdeI or OmpD-Associated
MPDYSFEAVLIRPEGVGTWTYLNIPRQVSSTFGSRGQVRVKGKVDGCPFRRTALPMGDGSHYLVIGKDLCDQIKKSAGDSVKVTLELDFEERQTVIPDDLRQALKNQPDAMLGFEKLSHSQQKLYVDWILNAKREATRRTRIEKALSLLVQGKKLRG